MLTAFTGDAAAPSPPVPLVTAVEQPAIATSPNTTRVPIFAALAFLFHHGG